MVENAPGMSALDMNTAEDMIVRNTREVVPGMIICGMEVTFRPSKNKLQIWIVFQALLVSLFYQAPQLLQDQFSELMRIT